MKNIYRFYSTFFLVWVTCTTGDRNNPVDANGTGYVNSIHVNLSLTQYEQFINDTLILIRSCDNPAILKQYECNITPTSISSDTLKFVWNKPGKQSVLVRAIDIYNRPSNYDTCVVTVLLGQPTVSIKKIDSTFIYDTISISANGKDTNGPVVGYFWSVNNSSFEKGDITFTRVFSDTGKKVIKVKVADDDGLESIVDSCVVRVKEGKPTVLIKKNDSCYIYDSISVIAHGKDVNGAISNYYWAVDSNAFILSDSIFTTVFTAIGNKLIKVKVTDDDSIFSTIDSCNYFVKEGKPIVSIKKNDTCYVYDTLSFKAHGEDVNGKTVNYFWAVGNSNFDKGDSLFTTVFTDTANKSIKVRVIDEDGIISLTDSCVVKIKPGRPVVTFISNDTIVKVLDTISFKARSTDSNGTVKKYIWQYTSEGRIITDTTDIVSSRNLAWTTAGTKRVILRALDDDGIVSLPDTCNVIINELFPLVIVMNDTSCYANDTLVVTAICTYKIAPAVKYIWAVNNYVFDDTTFTGVYQFVPTDSGKNIVRVEAICSDGKQSKLDSCIVNVKIRNLPPVPILMQPNDSASWYTFSTSTYKGSIVFRWNGNDPNGPTDIVSYTFLLGKDSMNLAQQYTGILTCDTISGLDTLTKYYWKVSVKDKSQDSAQIMGTFFTRYGAPIIKSEPHDTTVTKGDTAIFSIGANGYDLHYSWGKGSTVFASSDLPIFKIAYTDYADRDTAYFCIVKNSVGSDTSRFAKLIVKPAKPVITDTLKPVDTTVTQWTSVHFRTKATGDSLRFQWQKDGVDIVNRGLDTVFVLDSTKLIDNGGYRCIVSNSGGKDTTREAILVVKLAPPIVISNPRDTAVPEGGRVCLKVITLGDSLTYQWYKNDSSMSGQTNDTLYFANSTLPDSGVYHCVVSNPSGSAVSSDAKISVNSVYLYWTTSIIIDTVDCDKDGYNRKFLLKIDPNVKNSGTAFVYAKIYHKNHSDNSYTFISTTLSKTVVGTVSDLLYPDTLIGKEHGEYDYRIILYSNNFSIDTIDINNCKEEMPAQDEILPTITLHPVNKIDSVGVCDTIKATVTGTNLRYQWFKNGNVVSGNSSASIIFSSVYLSDNGQYKCILTNDAGSASDSVILTIHAKHNAQLFYDAFTSNSTSWDTAQSTSSKATISGGYFYFQGDSSYTYRRTRNIAPSSINCYSIESQLKYVSGTKELFGIVLCDNGSSWDNLYIFGIKDDGSCAIYKNLTGNNTNDWQNFFYGYRSVNSGIFNTLKVTKNGTDTYFYLNGQWVFTLSINDCAGTYAGYYLEGPQKIASDYLKITY